MNRSLGHAQEASSEAPKHSRHPEAIRGRKRMAEALKKGLCPICRKRTPKEGRKACAPCLKRQVKSAQARWARTSKSFVDLGICNACKTREAVKGRRRCDPCLEAAAESCKAQRAERARLGLCTRCANLARPGMKTCQGCSGKRPGSRPTAYPKAA